MNRADIQASIEKRQARLRELEVESKAISAQIDKLQASGLSFGAAINNVIASLQLVNDEEHALNVQIEELTDNNC